MRKTISVTVQIGTESEWVVYAGVVPASEPESPTQTVVEHVVRAMLKASSTPAAVLRHYVGPALVGTVSVQLD